MFFLSPRERAKDLMPEGQESLVIIVDYKSTTLRTNPPISVARKVHSSLLLKSIRISNLFLLGIAHPSTALRRDTRPRARR